MTTLVQQLYNAAALTAIYALVALGFTLVFGLTRLVNFAHGQMLTLGAFSSYVLIQVGLPFGLAVVISMAVVGGVGAALDRVLFRRTMARPLTGLIVSLGLISAFEAIFVMQWSIRTYQLPPPFAGVWSLAGVRITQPRLFVFGVAFVASAILFIALERTDLGIAARGLAEDAVAATVLGVPVSRLVSLSFFVGSALAGLAGALLATVFPFSAYSGFDFLLKGIAVAIIGGLGNVRGVVVASFILAIAETLGAGYASIKWSAMYGLGAMVLVLVVRPTGLFRGTESASSEGLAGSWAAPSGRNGSTPTPTRWRGSNAAGLVGAGAIILLLPFLLPSHRLLYIATVALIMAVVSYSLWLTFHYAGILSITQGAVMGVGAYTAAILSHNSDLNFWAQLPVAALAGALISLVIGVISFRTRGSTFLILTFAMAELVVVLFSNLVSLTGGAFGIVQAGAPTSIGPLHFSDSRSFFFLVASVLFVVVLFSTGIKYTGFGRRLTTIRDNELLARSLGLNDKLYRIAIFTMSGAVAAVGGVLFLYNDKYIEPNLFSAFIAINVLLIVIIGGIGSPVGPVVGALFIAFLPEVLRLSPTQSQLVYGFLLVMVILVLPRGLTDLATRYSVHGLAERLRLRHG